MTTYYGAAGATGNGVTSISWSCDFGSGSNRAGGVHTSHNGTISSVTIGGTSCTSVGSASSTYKAEIYALSAPSTGSQTVVVNFSASSAGNAVAVAMTDAHQTTSSLIADGVATGTGTSTAPSINVTGASGDLCVGHTASNTSFTPVTPGGSATEVYDNEDIFVSNWCEYLVASGASTTLSGTATGFEAWAMAGVAYKSAAGGGTSLGANILMLSDLTTIGGKTG